MKRQQATLILAFYPHARGFAYVLSEGRDFPVDWAMSDVRTSQKLSSILPRLERLLDRSAPDVLVLRAMEEGIGRLRSAKLHHAMGELAKRKGIPVVQISRRQIRQTFSHLPSPNRQSIAEEIVRTRPWLAWFAPPRRKIWNGEDRRMGLFDAVALSMAFLYQTRPSKITAL